MAGLLDGMRVLDLGMWRPTGHATSILVALGAEVLMVEPPDGSPMRSYPQIWAGIARGKRSVALDLRSDEGRRRAVSLAGQAHVVIEGWRPGVADRLGLGVADLRGLDPGLITCSISGFGQTGPWRDAPGHDLVFQALAGAVAPGPGDPQPRVPRLAAADLESGTLAATLICAAWAHRLQSGEGEQIDISMADCVAWWVGPSSEVRVAGAAAPVAGSPGYGVFATSDGHWLALAPLGEPRLWQAICDALDIDELRDVEFGDLLARAAEVNERIAAVIAGREFESCLESLRVAGAPVAPVLTPEEAAGHSQFVARGMVEKVEGETVVAVPAHLSVHPRVVADSLPEVGAHDGFSNPEARTN